MKRTVVLLAIALLLSGCVAGVLADPANSKWDSQQVTQAYQTDSDALIVLTWAVFSFLGALAAGIVFGWRRKR